MLAIGLRAEPKSFFWAISEGTQEIPVLLRAGKVEMPGTFAFPKGVHFLRTRLLQILSEDPVDEAGLRTPEMVRLQNESFRERLRVEGVLLATCAEAGINVVQGPLATLGRLLGVKAPKALLESEEYRGVDLESMPAGKREAVLMSVSLLKAERDGDSNDRKVRQD